MSEKIFISHASKDDKVAKVICTALENRGHKCWIASRDVGPGQNYMNAIVHAIRAAKVMVLVFTDNANRSDEILKELALASKYKVNVIPARVDDVVPSEAFELEFATRQWIDLFKDWEGKVNELSAWISGIVPIKSAVDATATAGTAIPPVPPIATTQTDTASRAAQRNAEPYERPSYGAERVRGRGFGLIGNMIAGIVGAFIAVWLLPRLGIYFLGGLFGAIINAGVGAAILLAIAGCFRRA
jgi:uncharacterized membrane protein YeaQ/YmgE (transglycosylase-associated protein family)